MVPDDWYHGMEAKCPCPRMSGKNVPSGRGTNWHLTGSDLYVYKLQEVVQLEYGLQKACTSYLGPYPSDPLGHRLAIPGRVMKGTGL